MVSLDTQGSIQDLLLLLYKSMQQDSEFTLLLVMAVEIAVREGLLDAEATIEHMRAMMRRKTMN
jgi:hypothetical protein